MAAILPFLETEPEGQQEEFLPVKGQLGALELSPEELIEKLKNKTRTVYKDIDGKPVSAIATSHTALTRLQWARGLIAQALDGAKFQAELDDGVVFISLSKTMDELTVPWHKAGQSLKRFQLFSTNSKMNCPTFDLSSGVGVLGGSCPGAYWGQSVVSKDTLRKVDAKRPFAERVIGHKVNLDTAVCQNCYASGGKYGEPVVQFSEVARLAMIRSMMQDDKNKNTTQLIDMLVYTITKTLEWDKNDKSLRHDGGIKPLRIHSSGDFFSTAYAEMWMEVARRVQVIDPSIRFWAPTRTHVLEEFSDMWKKKGFIPSNFAIRASGYHVGDRAPDRVNASNAKGTGVLTALESAQRIIPVTAAKHHGEMDHKKADFQCGVYALEENNKTCAQSKSPDGKDGCRACWTRHDLAVNYALH